jgi:UDP-N-acetylmuramate--alanine ligase
VRNALAAAAVALDLGVPAGIISGALGGFRGLARRLEELPPLAEICWIDDYAHHPTEVAASLAAVRDLAPGQCVWCVFQPHQASRTARLLDGFAASLQNADKILIPRVFRAREPAAIGDQRDEAELLVEAIRRNGGDATYLAELPQIEDRIAEAIDAGELTPGDVVVTMGAGDVGKIVHGLRQRLRKIRAAR